MEEGKINGAWRVVGSGVDFVIFLYFLRSACCSLRTIADMTRCISNALYIRASFRRKTEDSNIGWRYFVRRVKIGLKALRTSGLVLIVRRHA